MSSQDLIGPALPPDLSKTEDSDDERDFAGPALPPGYKRGEPSSSSDESEDVVFKRVKTEHKHAGVEKTKTEDDDDDGFFGPALPPGFSKTPSSPDRSPVLGPALPPGFRRAAYDDQDDQDEDGEDVPGPALPPGYQADPSSSEEEEDFVIGPMPAKGPVENTVALDIERRAQMMRDKLTKVDTPEMPSRDTWMTELPPELQHIGLGARTFKKKSGPEKGDRSIWTDTPADRERKATERREKKKKGDAKKDSPPRVSPKDLETAEKVSKYNNTKRSESLLSLHAKNLKEKAKEGEEQPAERRAFDRETDLQVNRFDEAQKQRLLKKSQELNTRFSHSKDRMFL
ncbi:GPALPP motifs-containing protein 1-like [Nerophis ophidion]|uniref:GPALPP motifs-containing protein 1-like n=1 Tax=Nerophis ophidion TaxID=159077 RepID=UPI002AE04B09|nr:GPALPP motifs-containing protein 1-like [Nerophis ophidion]